MLRLVFALLAVDVGSTAVPTSQPPGARCFRADRALGTSASSALGRGIETEVGRSIGEDSASFPRLRSFRLLDGGKVDRPEIVRGEWWARGSSWSRGGDTLRVRLSTMTSGWDLRLTAASNGGDSVYVGSATYLTDAVVVGGSWRPPQVSVTVRRERCTAPG